MRKNRKTIQYSLLFFSLSFLINSTKKVVLQYTYRSSGKREQKETHTVVVNVLRLTIKQISFFGKIGENM